MNVASWLSSVPENFAQIFAQLAEQLVRHISTNLNKAEIELVYFGLANDYINATVTGHLMFQ